MLILLKTVCSLLLVAVVAQDFKERKIYLWLLISVGILMSIFYFLTTGTTTYLVNIAVNLGVLAFIVLVLYLYARLKLKTALHTALGLGDLLFFISIAISFPITGFIILFTCSLLFALLIFQVLKPNLKDATVPLAGLQALFFLFLFSSNWIFEFINLYAL